MSQVAETERQLKVVVPQEMRRAIKMHVASREITVREFMERAIERALAEAEKEEATR